MQVSTVLQANLALLSMSYLKEPNILLYSEHKQFNQLIIYKFFNFQDSFKQVLCDYHQ